MHPSILSREQQKLLPLIKEFKKEFYLVGGTAIALHIGHRESIDFDLFKMGPFDKYKINRTIKKHPFKIERVYVKNNSEYTLVVSGVKLTFYDYPYTVSATTNFQDIIRLPSLLTLAAMKAFALGMRSKWKDYVDLYLLLKNHFSLGEIAKKARKIFGREFNEKLFSQQIAYFKDIDYREQVSFLIPNPPTKKEIETFLIEQALS